MEWQEEIVRAVMVHQALREHDHHGLWQYALPRVAATEAQIQRLEAGLGRPLMADHRQFLLHANGWPSFYQDVSLLGTADFAGGALADVLRAQLDVLRDLGAVPFDAEAGLIVAGSETQADMFIQDLSSGRVFWFAGELIDEFPSFSEFFLAMVDYNRQQLADFRRAE